MNRMAGALLDAQVDLNPHHVDAALYYRHGVEPPEYVPDFAAATAHTTILMETKMAGAMQSDEVRAKGKAATEWCTHATDYSERYGGRLWRYLLIRHDAVAIDATIETMAPRFAVRS